MDWLEKDCDDDEETYYKDVMAILDESDYDETVSKEDVYEYKLRGLDPEEAATLIIHLYR